MPTEVRDTPIIPLNSKALPIMTSISHGDAEFHTTSRKGLPEVESVPKALSVRG